MEKEKLKNVIKYADFTGSWKPLKPHKINSSSAYTMLICFDNDFTLSLGAVYN